MQQYRSPYNCIVTHRVYTMQRLLQLLLLLFLRHAGSFRSSSSCSQHAHVRSRRLCSCTATRMPSSFTTYNDHDHDGDHGEASFRAWLGSELAQQPGAERYPEVFAGALEAIVGWRRRFQGNPRLWLRLFKPEKVLKELVESAPILDAVSTFVAETSLEAGQKVTIVDLASGKGFLSMFCSEMLPPERVEKLILVDKMWPRCGAAEVLPHQMNWEHIYGSNDGAFEYYDTWPIRLHTSKQDLKSGATLRQMRRVIFDRSNGPVCLLAVHLCGTLSLRALDLFNDNPDRAVSFPGG